MFFQEQLFMFLCFIGHNIRIGVVAFNFGRYAFTFHRNFIGVLNAWPIIHENKYRILKS